MADAFPSTSRYRHHEFLRLLFDATSLQRRLNVMESDLDAVNATIASLNAVILAKDEQIKLLHRHEHHRQGELESKDQEIALYYKHMANLQLRLDRSEDALNTAHRQIAEAEKLNQESLQFIERYRFRCQDLQRQVDEMNVTKSHHESHIAVLQRQLGRTSHALDITANTSAVALPTTPQAPTAAQHLGIANSTMGRVPFTQLSRSASEHLTPASEQSTPGKRKLNPQSASFSPLADRLKDPKAQVEQSAPLFVTPKKATITLTPAVSERRSNAAPVSKFEAAPPSQVLPSAAAMPSGQATEKEGSTRAKPTIPPQLRPATPRPKPTSPKPSIAKAPIIARADAAESFNTTKLTEPTTSSKTEGAMPQPGQTVQKPDDQDGMMQRWFDQQLQTKTPDPTIVQLMAVQNDVKTSNLKPGKLIDFGDSPEAKSPPSPIRKPPVASSSNQGSRPPPFKTSSSTSLPKWNEAPVTNSKEGKENAPLVPFSPTPSLRPRPQIRAPSPQKFAERKLETFLSSDNALQPTTTDHTTLTPNRNTSTSPAHESPAAFLKAVASHLSTFSTKWSTPTKPHTDTPPRSPSPTPSSSLEEGEIRPSSSPASSSLKKVKSRSTDKDKDYHHPKPLFSYDDEPELLSSASYTDDPPPPAPKEEKEEQEKPPRKTSEGNRLTAASFEGNGDGRLIMRSGNWEPLGGRGAEPTGTRELGEEMDDESYAMVVRKQDRRRTAALERKLMWRKAVRRTSLGMDGYRWVLPRGFRME